VATSGTVKEEKQDTFKLESDLSLLP